MKKSSASTVPESGMGLPLPPENNEQKFNQLVMQAFERVHAEEINISFGGEYALLADAETIAPLFEEDKHFSLISVDYKPGNTNSYMQALETARSNPASLIDLNPDEETGTILYLAGRDFLAKYRNDLSLTELSLSPPLPSAPEPGDEGVKPKPGAGVPEFVSFEVDETLPDLWWHEVPWLADMKATSTVPLLNGAYIADYIKQHGAFIGGYTRLRTPTYIVLPPETYPLFENNPDIILKELTPENWSRKNDFQAKQKNQAEPEEFKNTVRVIRHKNNVRYVVIDAFVSEPIRAIAASPGMEKALKESRKPSGEPVPFDPIKGIQSTIARESNNIPLLTAENGGVILVYNKDTPFACLADRRLYPHFLQAREKLPDLDVAYIQSESEWRKLLKKLYQIHESGSQELDNKIFILAIKNTVRGMAFANGETSSGRKILNEAPAGSLLEKVTDDEVRACLDLERQKQLNPFISKASPEISMQEFMHLGSAGRAQLINDCRGHALVMNGKIPAFYALAGEALDIFQQKTKNAGCRIIFSAYTTSYKELLGNAEALEKDSLYVTVHQDPNAEMGAFIFSADGNDIFKQILAEIDFPGLLKNANKIRAPQGIRQKIHGTLLAGELHEFASTEIYSHSRFFKSLKSHNGLGIVFKDNTPLYYALTAAKTTPFLLHAIKKHNTFAKVEMGASEWMNSFTKEEYCKRTNCFYQISDLNNLSKKTIFVPIAANTDLLKATEEAMLSLRGANGNVPAFPPDDAGEDLPGPEAVFELGNIAAKIGVTSITKTAQAEKKLKQYGVIAVYHDNRIGDPAHLRGYIAHFDARKAIDKKGVSVAVWDQEDWEDKNPCYGEKPLANDVAYVIQSRKGNSKFFFISKEPGKEILDALHSYINPGSNKPPSHNPPPPPANTGAPAKAKSEEKAPATPAVKDNFERVVDVLTRALVEGVAYDGEGNEKIAVTAEVDRVRAAIEERQKEAGQLSAILSVKDNTVRIEDMPYGATGAEALETINAAFGLAAGEKSKVFILRPMGENTVDPKCYVVADADLLDDLSRR